MNVVLKSINAFKYYEKVKKKKKRKYCIRLSISQ